METLDLYIKAFKPIVTRVRTDVTACKRKDGRSRWTDDPLTDRRLINHLKGKLPRGVCPIKEGESTTMLAVLDMDSHKGETTWPEMQEVAREISSKLKEHGVAVIPFRSSGGSGMHLYAIWDKPQDAYSVRTYLKEILNKCGFSDGTKGVSNKQIEIFPKQDRVPEGGYGNQFILPMTGKSLPLDPITFELKEKEYFLEIDWNTSKPIPKYKNTRTESSNEPNLPPSEQDLAEVPELLNKISSEEYEIWIKVGMALSNIYNRGKEGMMIWNEWSKKSDKYKGIEEIKQKWPTFKSDHKNPVGIGTLRMLARESISPEELAIEFDNIEDGNNEIKKLRFQLIQAAGFAKAMNASWLIKQVLPKNGLAMVFGESGCGKTFFVMDFCLSLAQGKSWQEHKVKEPKKVVYVAAEGVNGIRSRLKAYEQYYNTSLSDLPFYLIDETPNLFTGDDAELLDCVRKQGGADLLVIDTLAQTTAGANENSGEHMGKVMNKCTQLAQKLDCLVLLVHHSGKDELRGSRGWSGIKGAMDAEINIKRKNDSSIAKVTKQKDGETGKQFPFTLETFVIGKDEDGDDISSCVVKFLDVFTDDKPNISGKWQNLLYEELDAEFIFLDDGMLNKNELINSVMEKYKKDHPDEKVRKGTLSRALDSLIEQGHLIEENDSVCPAQYHKGAQSV